MVNDEYQVEQRLLSNLKFKSNELLIALCEFHKAVNSNPSYSKLKYAKEDFDFARASLELGLIRYSDPPRRLFKADMCERMCRDLVRMENEVIHEYDYCKSLFANRKRSKSQRKVTSANLDNPGQS